jgi:hypothetical protein
MGRGTLIVLGSLVPAATLAGQDNPFAFTGGSVKSAYIVYEVTSTKKGAVAGASWEMGVAPDRWVMKSVMPFEVAGRKDTLRILMVTTRDSQYTYTVMGKDREGTVSPQLRPHLAREYAALGAAGKARFKENVKLMTTASGIGSGSDANELITLTGEKLGSETVGGHKCDLYKREKVTACVMPGAPLVSLRWRDENQGVSMVAKKITFNLPLPPAIVLLPKGVSWKKEPYDDADYIMGIWSLKKPDSDPETVPGPTLAKFAVGYLASPAATAELREMGAGMESGSAEDPSSDDPSSEAEADTSGN